jgi:hypothetical protein
MSSHIVEGRFVSIQNHNVYWLALDVILEA